MDVMLDLVKISDEDVLRNERALELIEAVHTSQRAIVDLLGEDVRKVGA
jgi:hypothetical protein